MTSATLVGFPEGPSVPAADVRRGRYVCPCGYGLRVFGRDATGGRHRVYFDPAHARLDDPVMNGECPSCGAVCRVRTQS